MLNAVFYVKGTHVAANFIVCRVFLQTPAEISNPHLHDVSPRRFHNTTGACSVAALPQSHRDFENGKIEKHVG